MTKQTIPGPPWIPGFLEALGRLGQAKKAIAASGVGQCTVYDQRRTNLAFAQAWDAKLPKKKPRTVPKTRRGGAGQRSGGWQAPFLEALAETSNVTAAAVRANVPLRTVYKLKRCNGAFAARWLEALHEGYDQLEMELLGYLRNRQPERKMDVTAALRLLAAHRETVERRRSLLEDEDEQAVLDSIDRFIDDMRERRAANSAILDQAADDHGAD